MLVLETRDDETTDDGGQDSLEVELMSSAVVCRTISQ